MVLSRAETIALVLALAGLALACVTAGSGPI
jgi:hypothetical protein